ncbi:lasso peptide biosynthesis B2 protein [Stenotrophomonas sp. MMGLT7]|uniref:lasso peptide biosynthesis B2 protein n=1 Tax=Stenotrophomonas sp. MMGLT7 TaxID=2901227 RepID=UPI001E5F9090|nr:lasso peptide biosynthesis B2 protein [Stenotrophomonas sp. MMGLT7]MCD7097841.1 lasso peptide biosynthesis B2 protein [Stenotrophomonas sp. MMGLT7]
MTNQVRRKAHLLAGMKKMMPLKLHDDLSYCKVDGNLIFLDIQNDRYFRLSTDLESCFVNYLEGDDGSHRAIQRLIEHRILIGAATDAGRIPVSLPGSPTRSAMEEQVSTHRTSISEVLDTFAIVCSTQLLLKTRRLKHVLARLASYREKRVPQALISHQDKSRTLDATAAFRSTRPYVPIDTCCLLDSIALVKFLAKRELAAKLVFGVTATPFSAHCWAQYETTVLNDTVGHVLAHTPIRVI